MKPYSLERKPKPRSIGGDLFIAPTKRIRGLISFADDGEILASPALGAAARDTLGLSTAPRLAGLRDEHRVNLALHRAPEWTLDEDRDSGLGIARLGSAHSCGRRRLSTYGSPAADRIQPYSRNGRLTLVTKRKAS